MNDLFKPIAFFTGSVFLMLIYRNRNKNRNIKEVVTEIKRKRNFLENESKLFATLFTPEKSTSCNKNISNKNEEEEEVWKRRILFQPTPSGNIVMYYDLYRQAFAYHSDTFISYPLLNLCAMKYVRLFLCRDFFVDTTVLPDSFVNPFNQMKEKEEMQQKQQASAKRKELQIDFDSSAFVKKTKPKTKVIQPASPPEGVIYKNNFRCIGKMSGDWNVLQPAPKIQPEIIDDYVYEHINTNKGSAKTSYSLWKMAMKS